MGTDEGSLEIERKYSVGAGFVLPDLSAVPGVAAVAGPDTYHLTAVYVDTPGQDLAAAKITLRRRSGGTDDGWHLKLPAGAGARREVHAPLGPGTEPVPERLAGLVAEWTRGQPLRPIARLQTTRTVRRLTGATGQVLAEVADDEVTGSLPDPGLGNTDTPAGPASWRTATSWREVEIELGAGPASLLDDAGRLLLEAGARPSPAASKLALVLSSAHSQGREDPQRPQP
jgi:inorganic triphosphatase YgiF